MMDWTDRHCRGFHRLLTRRALLYTEMVTAGAVIHGNREKLIGFHGREHPVALQLGGSDAGELAEACRIAHDFGYDEINLNCGCPSDRVRSGRFGACLMAEPGHVAKLAAAMGKASTVPVTVKCRIGIDDQDEEEALDRFVDTVADAGVNLFIVHARKAWLKGLSPKQNRDVPPLNYDRVFALKQRRPDLTIVLNGGLDCLETARQHLARVDGVMFGRQAYHEPWELARVDEMFFNQAGPVTSRAQAIEGIRALAGEMAARGDKISWLLRHVLGLYNGQPGARAWRRYLSQAMHQQGASADLIDEAMALLAETRKAHDARALDARAHNSQTQVAGAQDTRASEEPHFLKGKSSDQPSREGRLS